MSARTLSAVAGGSLLVLALAACSPTTSGDTEAGGLVGTGTGADCAIEAEIPIAAAFSLTGAAAQYGESQKNALEMAVDDLNEVGGVTYALTVEDDATDPQQAIQVFDGFISDGASVIIGPTLSNTAKQTNPVAQEAGVPVLGVSNTAAGITEIGDFIFRDSLTEDAVIPQTVTAAVEEFGLEKVVVMYSNDDAFTESGYQAFAAALEEEGVEVVETLTFSKTDTDFRALLDKAKQADPDALVVSALIEAAVPLVTQAREIGIEVPIIGGNGFNSPALIEGAGDAAEGVIVGAAWNSASDNEQ
ncbi:MAG TPA: ABC transporter substrate-binding protein, partial [Agromyces sp.]|nr:ABC transporter substrate-binding protein [Agromyces sp.]